MDLGKPVIASCGTGEHLYLRLLCIISDLECKEQLLQFVQTTRAVNAAGSLDRLWHSSAPAHAAQQSLLEECSSPRSDELTSQHHACSQTSTIAEKNSLSCHAGVTASVLALALAQLPTPPPDVAVYDGSWTEWGAREDLPKATGRA